jgi:DNA-binding winged helix-turn-helix (wHTH) protein
MTVPGDRAPQFAFGAWTLDPVRRILTFSGRPVTLHSRAFDALVHLVGNADRLVSKEELGRTIWGGRFVSAGSLNQLIFTLRRALSAEEPGQQYLITAPGRGYRFVSPVTATGDADPPEEPATAPASGRRPARKLFLGLAGLIGLLAIGVLAITGNVLYRSTSARLPPGRTGVVIADFENGSGDAVFDHLPAKVLDIDLRQSPFLNVLSDRQVQATLGLMTLRPGERLTPQLAAQVCIRNQGGAAISGSIAAVGSKYLLTLTATDCVNGRVLVDRKAEAASKEAVPETLDRLAVEVRRSLGESRGSIATFGVPLLARRTASFDALVSYSQGEWLFARGRRAEALPLFKHAVDLDPDFAAAWVALGIDLTNMVQ